MREKWKNAVSAVKNQQGQQGSPETAFFPETYTPKLLKVPSMRAAIDNYNRITTDNTHAYDNLSFISDEPINYQPSLVQTDATVIDYDSTRNITEITLDTYSNPPSLRGQHYSSNDDVYSTIRSSSIGGTNVSEAGTRQGDLGSSITLVSATKKRPACCSWFSYVETILCTASLAVGLGNIYRLPQTTLIRGGLPFLVAYIILTIVVGFPLLFLELGLGQLAQEGFTKIWRAVPLLRGVFYIKFLAGCFLSIYYTLYLAIFLQYIIWVSVGPIPFTDCSSVRITERGYRAEGISGQQCLQKTFLTPYNTDADWYGNYAGAIVVVWIVLAVLLFFRKKLYTKALIILSFLVVGCLVTLIVIGDRKEEIYSGLQRFNDDADWSVLKSADVWYYAAIQVFFSTYIGFGTFVTNAGIMFSKVNAFWTALGYIFFNLLFGVAAVLLTYAATGEVDQAPKTGDIAELHMATLIYNAGVETGQTESQPWLIVAYSGFFLAGVLSVMTLLYTLFKAINVETKNYLSWKKVSLIFCLAATVIGCAFALVKDFQIPHLFDHYVVGNIILITVFFEIMAFVIFYGSQRLQLDFEFILGSRLSKIWIGLWWFIPLLLMGLFVWALASLTLTGIEIEDSVWLYATGWGIVLTSAIFIIVVACYQIFKQDEYYTFNDKLKAVAKPLRKWGPVDPIMRYGWVQWHSKAKDGERDFTLKRRGTRDYTHSVKKRNKVNGNIYSVSEPSTVSKATNIVQDKNDLNQNNIRIISNSNMQYQENLNSKYLSSHVPNNGDIQCDKPLRVTSLIDSYDEVYKNNHNSRDKGPKTYSYPLSTTPVNYPQQHNYTTPDSYGTFRKGVLVINNDGVDHVCQRRNSMMEESTEL